MNDVREVHERVVGVLPAHVPVAERRDVQVGRDLFHGDAAVDAACGPAGLRVARGAVGCIRVPGAAEEGGEPSQAASLAAAAALDERLRLGPALGSCDDLFGGGCGRSRGAIAGGREQTGVSGGGIEMRRGVETHCIDVARPVSNVVWSGGYHQRDLDSKSQEDPRHP